MRTIVQYTQRITPQPVLACYSPDYSPEFQICLPGVKRLLAVFIRFFTYTSAMRSLFLLSVLILFSSLPLLAQEEGLAPVDRPIGDAYAQRIAELRTLELEGESLELMVADGIAFALYLPDGSGNKLGAVLLLHDQHNHLAAQPLETLRLGLPRYGWDTLSVQLPPMNEEDVLAWLEQASDVTDAALAHLSGQEIRNVVLIGHGSGGLVALESLFNTTRERVQGLIVISLDGNAHQELRLDAARQLAEVSVPVLDLYAQYDHPRVVSSTERRAREAQRPAEEGGDGKLRYRDIARTFSPEKGDRVHYRQLQIPTADHTFHPNRESLLRAVRGWLQRHTQKTP